MQIRVQAQPTNPTSQAQCPTKSIPANPTWPTRTDPSTCHSTAFASLSSQVQQLSTGQTTSQHQIQQLYAGQQAVQMQIQQLINQLQELQPQTTQPMPQALQPQQQQPGNISQPALSQTIPLAPQCLAS